MATKITDSTERTERRAHLIEEVERETNSITFHVMVLRNPSRGDDARALIADAKCHAEQIVALTTQLESLLPPALEPGALTEPDREETS